MMKKENDRYAHQRGEIKESAVKALVTDPLFRSRREQNRKGKGSYRRCEKHRKAAYHKAETPFKKVLIGAFLNGVSI